MALIRIATPRQMQLGLTILRVITGIIFAAHGGQKLFFYGISGVTAAFTGMGVPMASVVAPIITVVELFGGIALILGLGTSVVALALAVDMLSAILIVHVKIGFFVPGLEFPLSLVGAALTLAMAGPGAFSVDEKLASRG